MLFSLVHHRSEARGELGRLRRALLVGTALKLAFRRRKLCYAHADKLAHVIIVPIKCLEVRKLGTLHKLLISTQGRSKVNQAPLAVRACHNLTKESCDAVHSARVHRWHFLEQGHNHSRLEPTSTRGVRRGRATPEGHLWVAAGIASIRLNETLPEISKFSPLLAHSLGSHSVASVAKASNELRQLLVFDVSMPRCRQT